MQIATQILEGAAKPLNGDAEGTIRIASDALPGQRGSVADAGPTAFGLGGDFGSGGSAMLHNASETISFAMTRPDLPSMEPDC